MTRTVRRQTCIGLLCGVVVVVFAGCDDNGNPTSPSDPSDNYTSTLIVTNSTSYRLDYLAVAKPPSFFPDRVLVSRSNPMLPRTQRSFTQAIVGTTGERFFCLAEFHDNTTGRFSHSDRQQVRLANETGGSNLCAWYD